MISAPSGVPAYAALAVFCAVLAGYWHVFVKARRKGWEALVPGWNLVALTRIIGQPWWWALGLLPGPISMGLAWLAVQEMHSKKYWVLALPGLMLTCWVHYRASFDLARSFGRSRRFGWRLTLLPFIYLPVLGFGYSEYGGPARDMEKRRRHGRGASAKIKDIQGVPPMDGPANPA